MHIRIHIYIGKALVELQVQLDKNLIIRDIGIVYKKGGYKLS